MIPIGGYAAKWGNKGINAVKSIGSSQKAINGLVDRATEVVKKQVENVKTQVKSKVAEVKQQVSQMIPLPSQQKLVVAGGHSNVSFMETSVKNTTSSSPKPSNSQSPQNNGTGEVSKKISDIPHVKEPKVIIAERTKGLYYGVEVPRG